MLQSRKQRSITRVLLLAICALSIAACDLNTDPPPVSFLAIVSGNTQTAAAGAALPDPLLEHSGEAIRVADEPARPIALSR